jgi:hypothetical protein
LSEVELIAAVDEWDAAHPMPSGGRDDPAWLAWSDQHRAFLAELGTDSVALLRLRRRLRLEQADAGADQAAELDRVRERLAAQAGMFTWRVCRRCGGAWLPVARDGSAVPKPCACPDG